MPNSHQLIYGKIDIFLILNIMLQNLELQKTIINSFTET